MTETRETYSTQPARPERLSDVDLDVIQQRHAAEQVQFMTGPVRPLTVDWQPGLQRLEDMAALLKEVRRLRQVEQAALAILNADMTPFASAWEFNNHVNDLDGEEFYEQLRLALGVDPEGYRE